MIDLWNFEWKRYKEYQKWCKHDEAHGYERCAHCRELATQDFNQYLDEEAKRIEDKYLNCKTVDKNFGRYELWFNGFGNEYCGCPTFAGWLLPPDEVRCQQKRMAPEFDCTDVRVLSSPTNKIWKK